MDTSRQGQAAIEFAVGVFVFALAVTAIVEFAPVFYKGFELQSLARTDAGVAALGAQDGSLSAGGATLAISSRAHPPAETVDPWGYPIAELPAETRFGEWRSDAVPSVRLIQGVARKDFSFSMWYAGQALLDREQGELAEEVRLPALGGVSSAGVNP